MPKDPDLYVNRVDWDAAERSPLDYIPTRRLRAEEAYEPGTPEATVTETGGPLIDALNEVLASFGRGRA